MDELLEARAAEKAAMDEFIEARAKASKHLLRVERARKEWLAARDHLRSVQRDVVTAIV